MDGRHSVWGPSSSALWMNRSLGHWENQLMKDWPPGIPGPRRCTWNTVTHITGSQDIRLDLWETAIQATVYRQPNLRSVVDMDQEPHVWIPATDFSQVFNFRDLRETDLSGGGLSGLWKIVEHEVNQPWDYGSGKPLYRHTLLRVDDGYVVMNCFHHSAGDEFSGMLIMMEILERYESLLDGKEENMVPLQPLDCVEDLVRDAKDPGGVVDKMIKGMMARAASYKPILPLDKDEVKTNHEMEVPINNTLWREGNTTNYTYIINRCTEEEITVEAFILASAYMAKYALYASLNSSFVHDINVPMDICVDLRSHVESCEQYVGCNVSVIPTNADLGPKTSLWVLARQLTSKLKNITEEKQPLLANIVKTQLDTGVKSDSLDFDVDPEFRGAPPGDIFHSNVGKYPGPLVQSWGGEVKSFHFAVSYATPVIGNYLLLISSTDIFTYNLNHCPGVNNTNIANRYLDILVELVEGASESIEVTMEQIIININKKINEKKQSLLLNHPRD